MAHVGHELLAHPLELAQANVSRKSGERLPAQTPEAEAMSKDLKRRGFRFVGSTICYAFMQAVGIVDEHQRYCWAGAPARGA